MSFISDWKVGDFEMFGLFKGRKQSDLEFMKDLITAAAEGENRAKVNRALGSAGIQLPIKSDNAQYCIRASSAIVRLISETANVPVQTMDEDDKFVVGIFALVASDYVTRIIGAQFEIVSTIVVIDLLGHSYSENVSELGDAYNRMASEGRVIEAIGQNIAKWISNPTNEQIEKLGSLFKLCREYS